MIADPTTSFEPHSSEQLPASTRVYVEGQIHKDVRVPMREIALSPTKSFNGRIEVNEPVRVYDTSGPWGDPSYKGTVEEGLPALRKEWIAARNDVEEYVGREIQPRDNGYLTANHAEYAAAKREGLLSPLKAPINAQRNPLKAKPGKVVTQLAYARAGIITPEMEFIAIRENMRRAQIAVFEDFIASLAEVNLRPAQFSVLLVLDRAPGSTQSAVATALGIKRANFVAMLDELESRGLAERKLSVNDKRSNAIFLTVHGRKTLARARALALQHETRQIARLGDDGLDTLLRLLGRLSAR